jgi:hypothetical protein
MSNTEMEKFEIQKLPNFFSLGKFRLSTQQKRLFEMKVNNNIVVARKLITRRRGRMVTKFIRPAGPGQRCAIKTPRRLFHPVSPRKLT